jgi:hypothetical protein
MAVAEILMTKKECYTLFEDGHILMKKGKYNPTQPSLHDVYSKPEKPKPSPIDLVEHNIFGEEIYRENTNIRAWRIECEKIDEMNALEHQKQEKAFKRHLIEVRRNYRKQEAERSRTEKSKRMKLIERQRAGARAYITRLLQRQK